jgi:benzoyl-CoA reductase/2-hydroxyglutaryl-CoA dehydratase subunit BcrC/BadD/HgdB
VANVVYNCPFVPTELITACGHTPRRPEPAPRPASAGAETEGLCAWAAAFVESLSQQTALGAAVFTTACDQMRRAYELFTERSKRPAFLLNVPKTSGPTALAMLTDEYQRLARFLAALNGGTNDQNNLSQYLQTPQMQTPASADQGLSVVGGPLFDADLDALRQTLRRFGQTIVFDGTESAWRNYRTPCDQTKLNTDPLEALAQSYLSTPAVWKRPAAPFFDWLMAQLKTPHVKGVIIIQHPFCDYWRAAVYDIKSRLNLPVVTLETGEGGRFSSAALSRLDAFLEQFER